MKLFYREFGTDGSPIIIAHGLYGASDNWVSVARELGQKHRVFVVDLRNHGKSPHHDSHTYIDLANDLNELLVELGISKVALVGHSMGGKVMMQFALSFPEKVDKLVVLDIAPKSYATFQNFGVQTNNHSLILEVMRSLDFTSFTTRSDIENYVQSKIGSETISNFLLKNIARKSDGFYEWKLNVEALYNNLNNILDGFSETINQPLTPFKGTTLFLRGEQSSYFLDEDLHLARKLFPNSELTTIPNSGHWLHAEQPKLVVNSLLYFLE